MQTYRAILRGNRLEWTDPKPAGLNHEQPIQLTIVNTPDSPEALAQRQRMAKALERLAAYNVVAEIRDPVSWQREIGRDRPLTNRDE